MLANPHRSILITFVFALSLCSIVLADHHGFSRRRHAISHLEPEQTLSKRTDNAKMSYYEAGQGACGQTNNDNDYVSAPIMMTHTFLANKSHPP